jgi:hypothetical protein
VLGTLLVLALHAAPVAPTDVSRLDHGQLLRLYDEIEYSLPPRWPGVLSVSVGGVLYLPTLISLVSGLFQIGNLALGDNTGRDTLIASTVFGTLATLLVSGGMVLYKRWGEARADAGATLAAIEARLEVYERGEVPVNVPPPPALPPLQSTTGSLHVDAVDLVTSAPLAAAALRIDGRAQPGREIHDLQPGPHQLIATCDGYREARAYARVIAGRRVDVTLRLVPEGQEAPSRLSGMVRSSADGKPLAAMVDVEGKTFATDAGGIFSFELPPGRHTVRIIAPGYVVQLRQLDLKEGARVIFNADLQRP